MCLFFGEFFPASVEAGEPARTERAFQRCPPIGVVLHYVQEY